MKIKIFPFCLTAFLSASLLVGCGDNGATAPPATEAPATERQAVFSQKVAAQDGSQEVSANPADRYTSHDDGTVTDAETGLTWMACSKGQQWDGTACRGEPAAYSWRDASRVGLDFTYAGQSDWRLPTVEELKSLVYCSSGREVRRDDGTLMRCDGDFDQPTTVQEVFPGTPAAWFWTATASPHDREYYWSVHFGQGYVIDNDQMNNYHVRLVRD